MLFTLKTLIAAVVIAFTSWLAGRKPVLAGFIVALPLVSMLTIALSYFEHRSMEKTNQLALSILVAVPLSLSFFIPFILNRWLKMNFVVTYALGFGCLALAYCVHSFIFRTELFR